MLRRTITRPSERCTGGHSTVALLVIAGLLTVQSVSVAQESDVPSRLGRRSEAAKQDAEDESAIIANPNSPRYFSNLDSQLESGENPQWLHDVIERSPYHRRSFGRRISTEEDDRDDDIRQLREHVGQLRADLEAIRKQVPQDGEAPPEVLDKIDINMKATWKNGLELESPKKDFRVHVGGRTQFDVSWLTGTQDALAVPGGGSNGAGLADAVDFRRARLRVDGTMYDNIDWASEYDFVNSTNVTENLPPADRQPDRLLTAAPAPTDLWINFREAPWIGNLRVGNQKEPLALEHANSSRFLDFMERSFSHDAYTGTYNNGYTPGILVYNWTENERSTWALGAFKITNNPFAFDTSDGGYAVDGRVTCIPIYDEATDGRCLLHLGCGASYRGTENGQLRIRSRGLIRNGPAELDPVYADTGLIDAGRQSLIAPEAALVYGPWHFQTEYMASIVTDVVDNGISQSTYFSNGYYAQVMYFLTGEHRHYERKSASFGRIVPRRNALGPRDAEGRRPGHGAWQVGARYSYLNLNDRAVNAGELNSLTLGLNWFLNPNLKVQANYVFTHRDAPDSVVVGDIHAFGIRVAHDF